MKALAYLLGARALDLAHDRDQAGRPIPEIPPGPIASTEETASAWRRWAQAGDQLMPLASFGGRGPGAFREIRREHPPEPSY